MNAAPYPDDPGFETVPAGQAFHLLGIGGAGMSVVAELLAGRGHRVTGSDQRESGVLDGLRAAGVGVLVGHDAAHVPADAILVVSTAVRPSNPEYAAALERGLPIWHRSQGLAFAARGLDLVAVAGAHGKTTTSAMVAVALHAAGADPSWAVGGTLRGIGSGAHLGGGTALVAEADESDGSFLRYAPRVAIVTNVEPDHLDHYGSVDAFEAAFEEFARTIVPGGLLVACADDPGSLALARRAAGGTRVWTYGTAAAPGVGEEAHVHVDVVELGAAGSRARLTLDGGPRGRAQLMDLQVAGAHMVLNAAAAWAACVELGVAGDVAARALGQFQGTGRRFEPRGEVAGIRVVDDYAHHPTEVAATLRTALAAAGQGRVLALFQPHLYSRTRQFAAEFALALALADVAIVTDVYAAREDLDPTVSGETITRLAPAAGEGGGDLRSVPDRHAAALLLADAARPGDVLLTIGAGDVTELGATILDHLRELHEGPAAGRADGPA